VHVHNHNNTAAGQEEWRNILYLPAHMHHFWGVHRVNNENQR